MTQPDNTVPMIDVSSAQPAIDWAAVYASGVRAATVETAVGNDGGNPCAVAQVAGARAAGLLVGSYSFAYPIGLPGAGRDPQGQAARHAQLAAVAAAGVAWDLPHVLDLEWPERAQWDRWGCSADQIVQWVIAYSIARPEVTRLYVSPGYLAELGNPPELARFDLWLADWADAATVPAPWTDWAAWQHSAHGRAPGIAGDVDLSWLRVPPPT